MHVESYFVLSCCQTLLIIVSRSVNQFESENKDAASSPQRCCRGEQELIRSHSKTLKTLQCPLMATGGQIDEWVIDVGWTDIDNEALFELTSAVAVTINCHFFIVCVLNVVCWGFYKQSMVQSKGRKLCVHPTWWICNEDFTINVFT